MRMSVQHARERIAAMRCPYEPNSLLQVWGEARTACLAILDEEAVDSLDAAWVELEAWLPEGWTFKVEDGGSTNPAHRWAASAERWPGASGSAGFAYLPGDAEVVRAPSPYLALRGLAMRLRERTAAEGR